MKQIQPMRQPTQSVIFLFLEVLDSALQKNEPTSVQIFFFRKKKNTNKQTKIQRQNQNTSMHDILNPFPIFLVCFLKMVAKKRINLPKTKHHHNKF